MLKNKKKTLSSSSKKKKNLNLFRQTNKTKLKFNHQNSHFNLQIRNSSWLKKKQPRILISGAGLGGLTCALRLKQKGLDYVIIEPKDNYFATGKGVLLNPSAVGILRKLGLGQDLQRTGLSLESQEIKSKRGDIYGAIDLKQLGEKYKTPFVSISRDNLLKIMKKKVNVIEAKITGIDKSSTFIKCKIRGPTFTDSPSYDLLIGADGIQSPIRKLFVENEDFKNSTYLGWATFQTIINKPEKNILKGRNPNFLKKTVREVWGEGRRLFIMPLENDLLHVWGGFNTLLKAEKAIIGNHDYKNFKEVMDPFGSFEDMDLLVRKILESKLFEINYPMQAPNVSEYGKDHYALIGDAAHGFAPTLQDGAALAIEDGYVLANKLSEWESEDFRLSKCVESYSQERKNRIKPIQKDAIQLSLSGQYEISSRLRLAMKHLTLYYTMSSKSQEVRANRLAKFLDELENKE